MHKLSSSKHAAEGLLSVLFQRKSLVYSCCSPACRMLQQYLKLAQALYIYIALFVAVAVAQTWNILVVIRSL